jgi:hypothetical protein
VPVPGVIAADLVVVQAGLVLGGLEAFLDCPPGAGHPDQFGEGVPAGARQVKKACSRSPLAFAASERRTSR